MTLKLLKIINANGQTLPAGTKIRVNENAAEKMIRDGVACPLDLAEVMDEFLLNACAEIQKDGRWKATSRVREIEIVINKTYADVLAGLKSLDDFRAVVQQWKQVGTADREWNVEMLELIEWFKSADLPMQPFALSDFENILAPVKYYEVLRREIAAGTKGARSRWGVLQSDLQRLKAYCERRAEA